jgi:hypothetical protein
MLVVDAANVVGSRPDGWWKDRAGAAEKLCTGIATALASGQPATPIVVVLEGAARRGAADFQHNGLRITHAPHEGDERI